MNDYLGIDLQVYEKSSDYTNNYYGSKYNHWDFNKFKSKKIFKAKGNGFEKWLNGKILINDELYFQALIEYYKDLDRLLNNFINNQLDEAFHLFIYRTVMFKYPIRFYAVCNIWEEMFFDAAYNYYIKEHKEYEESYGIGYQYYFEKYFPNNLYQSFKNIDYSFNSSETVQYENFYAKKNLCRKLELYRFSSIHRDTFLENYLSTHMNSDLQFLEDHSSIFSHLKNFQ